MASTPICVTGIVAQDVLFREIIAVAQAAIEVTYHEAHAKCPSHHVTRVSQCSRATK